MFWIIIIGVIFYRLSALDQIDQAGNVVFNGTSEW